MIDVPVHALARSAVASSEDDVTLVARWGGEGRGGAECGRRWEEPKGG